MNMFNFFKKRKAQGLSLQVLIIALIALVVFVILIYIALKGRAIGAVTKCEGTLPDAQCIDPKLHDGKCPAGFDKRLGACDENNNVDKDKKPIGICCIPQA